MEPPPTLQFDQGLRYLVTISVPEQKSALLAQLPPPPNTAQVTADGGLLSNLKVSDNVLLPATYHTNRSMAALEKQVIALLTDCGLNEAAIRALMGNPPSRLSLLERRLVSFVRAVLLEPIVMVYDSLWNDLAKHEIRLVLSFDNVFRARYPAATSIYLHSVHHARPEVIVDRIHLCEPNKDE